MEGEGAGEGGEVTYARSQRFSSVRVCFEKHGDRLEKKPFFSRVSSVSLVFQVERDEKTI